MKKIILLLILCGLSSKAQSLIASVNAGSLITNSSSVSVGEIIVVPESGIQSPSGIIGILAQVNEFLEVASFEISTDVVAYPNPTSGNLAFTSYKKLSGEIVSIFDRAGKLVMTQAIDPSKQIDLASLQAGVYLIKFDNIQFKSFKIIKR